MPPCLFLAVQGLDPELGKCSAIWATFGALRDFFLLQPPTIQRRQLYLFKRGSLRHCALPGVWVGISLDTRAASANTLHPCRQGLSSCYRAPSFFRDVSVKASFLINGSTLATHPCAASLQSHTSQDFLWTPQGSKLPASQGLSPNPKDQGLNARQVQR